MAKTAAVSATVTATKVATQFKYYTVLLCPFISIACFEICVLANGSGIFLLVSSSRRGIALFQTIATHLLTGARFFNLSKPVTGDEIVSIPRFA